MVANNAGMPATPADLINVDEVIGKYYDVVPDPNVPEPVSYTHLTLPTN
mgnify:CR=1 FL=1